LPGKQIDSIFFIDYELIVIDQTWICNGSISHVFDFYEILPKVLEFIVMSDHTMRSLDGNEAVAYVAYRVTELSTIYPITPSSNMAEHADEWASLGIKNIWGTVPQVVEMQSEAGASAALHGVLQSGGLGTTFTASQGLLLMIPSMYKIAGELTPTVIHVAARSLACQALSIFGDHSDVMSTRDTGFAMLSSGSVQEAHDLALIAHASTLKARVPFLHFFEGFRVSHEVNKIHLLSEDIMRQMIDEEFVVAHRERGLNPEHPCIRGTSQNPDVYFQGRETVNTFYEAVPEIVQQEMNKFADLTGRQYQLVSYCGPKDADRIIVIMGSGYEPVIEAVKKLEEKGEKIGVVKVHLYRPFPKKAFLNALPKSVKKIAILDRTKEPGSVGEPLYIDIVTTLNEMLAEHVIDQMPQVIGGRYGLSSKEFTPAMAKAVFDEIAKDKPKNHFTIGINDDVTQTSLPYDSTFITESSENVRALFFGLGADGTVGANKNTIKIIGDNTALYGQGYFVYDSKKSGARTISHLRFGPKPITSSYLIQRANFIAVHQFNFFEKVPVLKEAEEGATLLINSPYPEDQTWHHLPRPIQEIIINKKVKVYAIDAYRVGRQTGMGERINTIMQTCFFHLANVMPEAEAISKIKDAIKKTYSYKGEEIVKRNYSAVDNALENLYEIQVPAQVDADAVELPPVVSANAPDFVKNIVAPIMRGEGDELPVSAFAPDGTFPTATTRWEKRNISLFAARWNPDICIQCGRCSVVCPHGVIRAKRYDAAQLNDAPEKFRSLSVKGKGVEDKRYTLQVYLEDCTACGLCYVACPAKSREKEGLRAINVEPKAPILEEERKNIEIFEKLKADDPWQMNTSMPIGLQFIEPLFEFSGACTGCGETPYLKLISQLFGDRMVAGNATGCSSIYGGNLPTTPWAVNAEGHGPAWNNSLFEDCAEFTYGFRLTADKLFGQAKELVKELSSIIGDSLAEALLTKSRDSSEAGIQAQRKNVTVLRDKLKTLTDNPRAQLLFSISDYLIKRSIWAIGGDGWAYDIGYGGLDHVLASDRNVNLLVMDTEVYSNTGGQASKATPMGAVAKFAAGGKRIARKNLGLIAMTYGYVYVAQISLANLNHAIKAIKEAEAYDGPSLILCYSHCIAHGYPLTIGLDQQKKAVESGYWPLYRYNPAARKEGKNPFTLDSQAPKIPLKDYICKEARYRVLFRNHADIAETLLKEHEAEVKRRWSIYENMAKGDKIDGQ
jgi:pyruvate-ferredoxin/flavodoxin oxidoreductase